MNRNPQPSVGLKTITRREYAAKVAREEHKKQAANLARIGRIAAAAKKEESES